jgi:DNA mismatch repair protein MutL
LQVAGGGERTADSGQQVAGGGQRTADSGQNALFSRKGIAEEKDLLQLHETFILIATREGFLLVHQQNAHERVLYERYLRASQSNPLATQRSLFPVTLHLPPADSVLLDTLLPELSQLGYQVEPFGKDTFVVQGTPADVSGGEEIKVLEGLLEHFKNFNPELKLSQREKLIRTLAMRHAIKPGQKLAQKEMLRLIEDLFQCEQVSLTADGKPIYLSFEKNSLQKMFGRL